MDTARVGANQDLFRQVNKKVASFGDGDLEFIELIDVRRDPTRFAVHPTHVDGRFERVVESGDRYVIVEKFGDAGEVAVALEEDSPTP